MFNLDWTFLGKKKRNKEQKTGAGKQMLSRKISFDKTHFQSPFIEQIFNSLLQRKRLCDLTIFRVSFLLCPLFPTLSPCILHRCSSWSPDTRSLKTTSLCPLCQAKNRQKILLLQYFSGYELALPVCLLLLIQTTLTSKSEPPDSSLFSGLQSV